MTKSKQLIQEWQGKKGHPNFSTKAFQSLNAKKAKKNNLRATEIHYEVFEELDCLDCAHCCKSIPPIVNAKDISRISSALNISERDFMTLYTVKDEDGDRVMNASPCPFLEEDNACSIYENRPQACRKYPHTGEMEFAQHLTLHKKNIVWCPAVFHIIKRLTSELDQK